MIGRATSDPEMKGGAVLGPTLNGGIALLLLPAARVGLGSGVRFADVLWWDIVVSSPLALLVFWRTLVHARRFRRNHIVGLQPLMEAAMTGLCVSVLLVYPALPGTLSVYPFVLGGAAVGLICGVLFESIALLCLTGAGAAAPTSALLKDDESLHR